MPYRSTSRYFPIIGRSRWTSEGTKELINSLAEAVKSKTASLRSTVESMSLSEEKVSANSLKSVGLEF